MIEIAQIEKYICERENIRPFALHFRNRKGKLSRKAEIKEARQIIMFFAMELGYSQATTGGYFGLDHATAYNAKVFVNNCYMTEKLFKAKIDNYSKYLLINANNINNKKKLNLSHYKLTMKIHGTKHKVKNIW